MLKMLQTVSKTPKCQHIDLVIKSVVKVFNYMAAV